MKWLMNFSPNFLNMLIDLGSNDVKQDLATFYRVARKTLYVMASSALWIDMLVRNISRWSMGSTVLVYDSMVGSLKPFGGMDLSKFYVNGKLLSVCKLTYTPSVVTCFSITSILDCMSSHFFSILASSLCLLSMSLRFTSLFPSSFWRRQLSSLISCLASNFFRRSVVDFSSSTFFSLSSYLALILLEKRWLGIRDSSGSHRSQRCVGGPMSHCLPLPS